MLAVGSMMHEGIEELNCVTVLDGVLVRGVVWIIHFVVVDCLDPSWLVNVLGYDVEDFDLIVCSFDEMGSGLLHL